MAGEVFVPAQSGISNRGLIKRMQLWGWKVRKVNGEFTTMEAPNGAKVDVKSEHHHERNSKWTIDEVLQVQNMPWSSFMQPMTQDMLMALKVYSTLSDEEKTMLWESAELAAMTEMDRVKEQQKAEDLRRRDERAQERRAERDRKREKARQDRVKQEPIEETPMSEPTPDAPPQDTLPIVIPTVAEVKAKQRTRGVTNSVLDLLVEHDEPISMDRLCVMLPQHNRSTINNAANHLHRIGVAERVKHGVYRLRPEARRGADYKVEVGVHASPPVPVDAVRDAQGRPVDDDGVPYNIPDPAPAQPRSTETEDDLLNETLDLLFPQGFKARHLPLIDEWRKATIALMRDINH